MIEKVQLFKGNNFDEVDLNYFLYYPKEYEKNIESHPLVLFLHGADERGDNLEKIKLHGIPKLIAQEKSLPFTCIAPQCPINGYWNRSEYVNSLVSLVNEVKQYYGIDSKKIHGTGLSMGGLGIMAMAIQEPDMFSSIIPICGGAELTEIKRLKDLPIWLFHGELDEVHPVENSISIYDTLKPINKNIYLTIYENVYHDSWTQTYENPAIYDWLLKFSQ